MLTGQSRFHVRNSKRLALSIEYTKGTDLNLYLTDRDGEKIVAGTDINQFPAELENSPDNPDHICIYLQMLHVFPTFVRNTHSFEFIRDIPDKFIVLSGIRHII